MTRSVHIPESLEPLASVGRQFVGIRADLTDFHVVPKPLKGRLEVGICVRPLFVTEPGGVSHRVCADLDEPVNRVVPVLVIDRDTGTVLIVAGDLRVVRSTVRQRLKPVLTEAVELHEPRIRLTLAGEVDTEAG